MTPGRMDTGGRERERDRQRTHRDVDQVLRQRSAGEHQLDFAESQLVALAQCVHIQDSVYPPHAREPQPVDQVQQPNLFQALEMGRVGEFEAEDLHRQQGEQELQWIDEEQDQHQDGHGHDPREGVFETVAPVIPEMRVPEHHQQHEADHEGREPTQHVQQAFEGVRHLERHHQQRHGEGKHGVGESFDSRDLGAAPAEMLLASWRERQTLAQALAAGWFVHDGSPEVLSFHAVRRAY